MELKKSQAADSLALSMGSSTTSYFLDNGADNPLNQVIDSYLQSYKLRKPAESFTLVERENIALVDMRVQMQANTEAEHIASPSIRTRIERYGGFQRRLHSLSDYEEGQCLGEIEEVTSSLKVKRHTWWCSEVKASEASQQSHFDHCHLYCESTSNNENFGPLEDVELSNGFDVEVESFQDSDSGFLNNEELLADPSLRKVEFGYFFPNLNSSPMINGTDLTFVSLTKIQDQPGVTSNDVDEYILNTPLAEGSVNRQTPIIESSLGEIVSENIAKDDESDTNEEIESSIYGTTLGYGMRTFPTISEQAISFSRPEIGMQLGNFSGQTQVSSVSELEDLGRALRLSGSEELHGNYKALNMSQDEFYKRLRSRILESEGDNEDARKTKKLILGCEISEKDLDFSSDGKRDKLKARHNSSCDKNCTSVYNLKENVGSISKELLETSDTDSDIELEMKILNWNNTNPRRSSEAISRARRTANKSQENFHKYQLFSTSLAPELLRVKKPESSLEETDYQSPESFELELLSLCKRALLLEDILKKEAQIVADCQSRPRSKTAEPAIPLLKPFSRINIDEKSPERNSPTVLELGEKGAKPRTIRSMIINGGEIEVKRNFKSERDIEIEKENKQEGTRKSVASLSKQALKPEGLLRRGSNRARSALRSIQGSLRARRSLVRYGHEHAENMKALESRIKQ